jgi:hypothetical protein
MNSEEMLCEAEDLVRGSGKAHGSGTKRGTPQQVSALW